MKLIRVSLALAALVVFQSSAAGDETLRRLLIEYRCPVVDRLAEVHEASSERNRFLVIAIEDHPQSYVQCLFYEGGTKLLCEASSGFYRDKDGEPRTLRLVEERVSALARLGFSTDDTEGNFQRQFDVSTDLNALADFMLTALHDGYGARSWSKLKFNAPFAQTATSRCVPLS